MRNKIRCNPMVKKGIIFGLSFFIAGAGLGAAGTAFASSGISYSKILSILQQSSGEGAQRDTDPAETTGMVDNAAFVYLDNIPLAAELQEYTYTRCQQEGIEYELVLAVMWRESRFQVDAVGYNKNGTQDSGIMQINDVNREWLRNQHGIDNLMDPYQNIHAGTAMLAGYFHTYGDEKTALMAYQLGEGGMLRQQAQGVTATEHTNAVLATRDNFKQLCAQAAAVQKFLQEEPEENGEPIEEAALPAAERDENLADPVEPVQEAVEAEEIPAPEAEYWVEDRAEAVPVEPERDQEPVAPLENGSEIRTAALFSMISESIRQLEE